MNSKYAQTTSLIPILVYGFTALCVIGLIACCAVVLLVPDAMASQDAFGREYTAAVSYTMCPELNQWAGLRFSQVREGLPGIWYEFRASDEWNTGTGGVTVVIDRTTAIALGAGVSFKNRESGANFHIGLIKKLWKLDFHAGYNTKPAGLSFGLGCSVW